MDKSIIKDLSILHDEYARLSNELDGFFTLDVKDRGGADICINRDYLYFAVRLRVEILDEFFKYYEPSMGNVFKVHDNFVASYITNTKCYINFSYGIYITGLEKESIVEN